MQTEMQSLPSIVSAGEALIDLIRVDGDCWISKVGGGPWNVARAAASLGVPSAFAGSISQDWFGDALWSASTWAKIDLRFIQRVPQPPLLAVVHQLTPPAYTFIGSSSADLAFDPSQLPAGWQNAARWVHFGGISLARPPLSETLLALAQQLKAQGVRISYDPNYRTIMTSDYDPMLHKMARLADVIKVSDEDLVGLFRTPSPDHGLACLRDMNPDAVVMLTQGERGAHLHVGEQSWHAAPPPVDIIDTIGAGDACMAGLLCSLLQRPGEAWPAHLRFAVAAGAAACLNAGATPPTPAQVADLIDRII